MKPLRTLSRKAGFRKHDFSLLSGERQTASSLDGIRRDHVLRYELAASQLKKRLNRAGSLIKGADIFCGNGYGSCLLVTILDNINLLSVDASAEAINMASKYYPSPHIEYVVKRFPFQLQHDSFDFFVSLESIEHIKNDALFLKTVANSLKGHGLFIVSTPNSYKFDLKINRVPFHFRHYTFNKFIRRASNSGFHLLDWYGQDTYLMSQDNKITGTVASEKMDIKERYEGQFLIYVLQKRG